MASIENDEKTKVIMKRKEDGINICLKKSTQARSKTTLFEDMDFLNNSLPEIDFEEIDTSTTFLGHKFSAPLLVSSMTGGAELAKKINRNIAEAVQEAGIGMSVGSQRAGLFSESLSTTYSVVRDAAPDAFIGSNIGGAQLSLGMGTKEVKKLIEMIRADALFVHLNPLQELIQPEGNTWYKGVSARIKELVEGLGTPVIAKEVGHGLSEEIASKLEDIGVSAVDIQGAGGTTWAGIESYRAEELGDETRHKVGNLLWDWGIPTAAALYRIRRKVKIPVISSGGIRTGIDVAKSIAMGADMAAMAYPLLRPATISSTEVKKRLDEVVFGLKAVMFITGSRNIKDLKKAKYVITGKLKEWCEG